MGEASKGLREWIVQFWLLFHLPTMLATDCNYGGYRNLLSFADGTKVNFYLRNKNILVITQVDQEDFPLR